MSVIFGVLIFVKNSEKTQRISAISAMSTEEELAVELMKDSVN